MNTIIAFVRERNLGRTVYVRETETLSMADLFRSKYLWSSIAVIRIYMET